jgi:uncharacterized protein YecE (DUF72 family)
MQDDLFGGPPVPPQPPPAPPSAVQADLPPAPPPRKKGIAVSAQPQDDAVHALAARLPPTLRLGTSTWTYPGWKGLVWEGEHSPAQLSKNGLSIYARHPLLRTVSIDRSFYRPLTVSQYERYASQVPDDFRFVVKAPSLVTDALVRSEDGRGREPNPAFLNADLARTEFVEPALQGLGPKIGALVFQLSPLPMDQLDRLPEVLQRLRATLLAQPKLAPIAPDGILAVEVRDPEWISTHWMALDFAAVLREAGATYCIDLHPKMPPLADQLHMLRALWPGPLVCRWMLNPVHGPYGYEEAEKLYEPFDRLHHPDLHNREELARLIAGVTGAGQNAFVCISNHAEGSAPLTTRALAEQVAAQPPARKKA